MLRRHPRPFISHEGFRRDGRLRQELRDIDCVLGRLATRSEGSAEVRQGCTRVMAYVTGPMEIPGSRSITQKGTIRCTFSFSPFSRPFRGVQRATNKKCSARAAVVENLLRAVVRLENYKRSTIVISIVVMQDDGGALAAAVNASILALLEAGVQMSDVVSAASVALLGKAYPLFDPTDEELRASTAEMTMATFCSSGKIACIQAWAKINSEEFAQLVKAGQEACKMTADLMIDTVVTRFAGFQAKAEAFRAHKNAQQTV